MLPYNSEDANAFVLWCFIHEKFLFDARLVAMNMPFSWGNISFIASVFFPISFDGFSLPSLASIILLFAPPVLSCSFTRKLASVKSRLKTSLRSPSDMPVNSGMRNKASPLAAPRTYCRAALFFFLLLQQACNTAASSRSASRRKDAVSLATAPQSYPTTISLHSTTSSSSSVLASLVASKFASPLSYDATLLNTWGFKRVGCGKGDFLVADTGMVDNWICAKRGEQLVTAAMEEILSAGCRKHNDREADALFLDVGSNTGFYGLNAISHGCAAAFFDVQPGCNKVVNAALLVNGFADHGVVLAAGLSDRMDFVQASSMGTCSFESGRFPISAIETGTLEEGDVSVPVVPLSRVLPPSSSMCIFMMKIDTEGLEQRVLSGAMPLFKEKCIEHVIVEVTPGGGFWEKRGIVAADVANTMRDIAACGYKFTRLSSKASTTDPKRVHALFSKRNFEQEDFLISRM